MVGSTQYHIKGLVLQVSNKSFIVQVYESKQQQNQDQLADLPEWMFHSRNAIWLVDGKKTMYDRAVAGEEIKKKLMAELPDRISQDIWS